MEFLFLVNSLGRGRWQPGRPAWENSRHEFCSLRETRRSHVF